MEELEEASKFHGHLCPMFAFGFRMGKKALKELGREREDGVKLMAVVEFKNCLADGIQYICGTTYGKNNLFYKGSGKFAASFYDLVSGKSLRISIKNEVLEDTLEYGVAGQEVKRLPPNRRREEARRLFKMGKEVIKRLKEMGDGELFTITKAEPFKAEEEPPLDFVICEGCGEVVLTHFINEYGGKKVCNYCFERVDD
ncbi:MAG: FmdE family protein [Candidatus Hydrothermarchaeales archaeon]